MLACGIVHAYRKGLPIQLGPKAISQECGQFRVAQKDSLTYSVWKGTKVVLTLSTFHLPDWTCEMQKEPSAGAGGCFPHGGGLPVQHEGS